MLTVVITFVVIIVVRATAIRKLIMSTVGEFPYGTLLTSLVSDFITLISVNAAGLRERRRLRYQLDPGFHRRNSRGGDQRRPAETASNPCKPAGSFTSTQQRKKLQNHRARLERVAPRS
jgi:hypothetical protein